MDSKEITDNFSSKTTCCLLVGTVPISKHDKKNASKIKGIHARVHRGIIRHTFCPFSGTFWRPYALHNRCSSRCGVPSSRSPSRHAR